MLIQDDLCSLCPFLFLYLDTKSAAKALDGLYLVYWDFSQ